MENIHCITEKKNIQNYILSIIHKNLPFILGGSTEDYFSFLLYTFSLVSKIFTMNMYWLYNQEKLMLHISKLSLWDQSLKVTF